MAILILILMLIPLLLLLLLLLLPLMLLLLLLLLLLQGEWSKALSMLDEMRDGGVKINGMTYSGAIKVSHGKRSSRSISSPEKPKTQSYARKIPTKTKTQHSEKIENTAVSEKTKTKKRKNDEKHNSNENGNEKENEKENDATVCSLSLFLPRVVPGTAGRGGGRGAVKCYCCRNPLPPPASMRASALCLQ